MLRRMQDGESYNIFPAELVKFQFVELLDYPCCRGGSLNHGVIATGNHIHSDSLRGAPPSRRKIRPRWADFPHIFVFRFVFTTFAIPRSGRVKTLPYGYFVCKLLYKSPICRTLNKWEQKSRTAVAVLLQIISGGGCSARGYGGRALRGHRKPDPAWHKW